MGRRELTALASLAMYSALTHFAQSWQLSNPMADQRLLAGVVDGWLENIRIFHLH